MSFSLTTAQFLDGSKTVTRRCGWWGLQPGAHILAVEKAMGLKKGEHQRILGEIEVVSSEAVHLNSITKRDCAREGFPEMSPRQFVGMFCKAMRCGPDNCVNRIEFRRLPNDTLTAEPKLQVPLGNEEV